MQAERGERGGREGGREGGSRRGEMAGRRGKASEVQRGDGKQCVRACTCVCMWSAQVEKMLMKGKDRLEK